MLLCGTFLWKKINNVTMCYISVKKIIIVTMCYISVKKINNVTMCYISVRKKMLLPGMC